MTTNVLDLESGIAATDSRWSLTTRQFFAWVDDTGFEKMTVRKPYLMVFAGAGSLIQEWKDWAAGLPQSLGSFPDFIRGRRAVAITITDTYNAAVLFERMQRHSEPNARFTGTGAPHAFACWEELHDAIAAVKSAILMDRRSGGTVKYYRFDGKTNLAETIRLEGLKHVFANEGMIMSIGPENEPRPIREAAQDDPGVRALLHSIESGEAEILSPCEEMYRPWTDEEKRHFVRVATNMAKHLKEAGGSAP